MAIDGDKLLISLILVIGSAIVISSSFFGYQCFNTELVGTRFKQQNDLYYKFLISNAIFSVVCSIGGFVLAYKAFAG